MVVLPIGTLSSSSRAADDTSPFKVVGRSFLTESGEQSAVFGDDPIVCMNVDREYLVIALRFGGRTCGYVLNPDDGNSAMSILTVKPANPRTDSSILQQTPFAKIARKPGIVGGEKVAWREWIDEHHLYAGCQTDLVVAGSPSHQVCPVDLEITANSAARRQSLEDCVHSMSLVSVDRALVRKTRIGALQQAMGINDASWILVMCSSQGLRWVTPYSEIVTLGITPGRSTMPDPASRAQFQDAYRVEAKSHHGGIVEVESIERSRVVCGLVTEKFPLRNLGWMYSTKLIIPTATATYTLEVKSMEFGTTGIREATTLIIDMKQRGITDISKDSFALRRDPYDRKYDDGALFQASDERRWDKGFPRHPLTRCRTVMASLLKSLTLSDEMVRNALHKAE